MSSIPFDGFTWVPLTFFIVIIIGSMLIGLVSNWKTSLYFLGGNATLGIAGIFIFGAVYDKWIIDKISNSISSKDIDLLPFLHDAKAYIGATILFIILLIVNLILGIIYIFIRKHLKLKPDDTHTLLNRLSSASMSTATGVIIAVSASSATGAVFEKYDDESEDKGFARFTNKVMYAITFKQMYDSQNIQRLAALGKITNDTEHVIDMLGDIFGGDLPNPDDQQKAIDEWNNNRDMLRLGFGNPDILESILSGILNKLSLKEIDKNSYENNLKGFLGKLLPLKLGQGPQNVFKEFLNKNIWVSADLDKNEVITFMTNKLIGDGK